jgi:F-type H+-transporting ATPase subunit b
MFVDPQFWVAIAFVIFIAAIFNPIRKMLGITLNRKIQSIKNSIEEAENIKNETQNTLSDLKKRQNDVKVEIENIHKDAREKIKILESQAEEKLKEKIDKRNLLAAAKIEQLTRDANAKIQRHISQAAIEAVVTILKKKLDQDEKQNLINRSIKELSSVFNN